MDFFKLIFSILILFLFISPCFCSENLHSQLKLSNPSSLSSKANLIKGITGPEQKSGFHCFAGPINQDSLNNNSNIIRDSSGHYFNPYEKNKILKDEAVIQLNNK